jgi:hypothetical protein
MCHQKQVVTREFQGMNTGRLVSFVLCQMFLQRRSISTGTFLEDRDESWTWTWTWRRRRSVILSDYPSGLVSGALIPSPGAIRMRVRRAARYYIQQHQHQDSRQSDCSQHCHRHQAAFLGKGGGHAKTKKGGSAQSDFAPRYDSRTPLLRTPHSQNQTSATHTFYHQPTTPAPFQKLTRHPHIGSAALFCLPQHSKVFCCYSMELRTLCHLTCQERGSRHQCLGW